MRFGRRSAFRKVEVLKQVRQAAANVVGDVLQDEEPFMDVGMDSLGAIEFRHSLRITLGLKVPTTVSFDYPTVAAVASLLWWEKKYM